MQSCAVATSSPESCSCQTARRHLLFRSAWQCVDRTGGPSSLFLACFLVFLVFWFCSFLLGVCKKTRLFALDRFGSPLGVCPPLFCLSHPRRQPGLWDHSEFSKPLLCYFWGSPPILMVGKLSLGSHLFVASQWIPFSHSAVL